MVGPILSGAIAEQSEFWAFLSVAALGLLSAAIFSFFSLSPAWRARLFGADDGKRKQSITVGDTPLLEADQLAQGDDFFK